MLLGVSRCFKSRSLGIQRMAAAGAGLHVEARLAELGYKLPPPGKPVASYVMVTRVGNLLYTGALRCSLPPHPP